MLVKNLGGTPLLFLPNINSKNFNIHNLRALVAYLKQTSTEQTRQQILFQMGIKILEEGKEWPLVNWTQFALMHSGAIIENTMFDGGSKKISIAFWLSLLNRWEQNDGLFLNVPSEMNIISSLRNHLQIYQDLLDLEPSANLQDELLEEKAATFLIHLHQLLCENESVYIPLGYTGESGHHLPIFAELQGDHVIVTFLNQGAGSYLHPLIDYTSTSKKVSHRYFPIKIPKDVFFGEMGRAAFCLLFRYQSVRPKVTENAYSTEEIISIFLRMGSLCPFSHETNLQRLAVFPQIGNTCSEQGVKLVVRDILYVLGLQEMEIERIFLNAYLCSLISAYHTYLEDPSLQHCHLLAHASKEFGIATENNELSKKERVLCETVSITLTKFCKLQAKRYEQLPMVSRSLKVSELFSLFPRVPISLELAQEEETAPTLSLEKPTFCSETFAYDIKRWALIAEQLPPAQARAFAYQILLNVPFPDHVDKPYDTLPAQEIGEVLKNLKMLIVCGVVNTEEVSFLENYLMLHTAYALADYLARLCPWTHLEGFSSPLPLSDQPSTSPYLPLGEECRRFEEISYYFNHQKGEKIFPFQAMIPIESWVKKLKKNPEDPSRAVSHLKFLKQFLKNTSYNQAKAYADLYTNEQLLPPEIIHLQYFAFACHALFSREAGAKIPRDLTFRRSSKMRGQLCLEIEAEKDVFHFSLEAPRQSPLQAPHSFQNDFADIFYKHSNQSTNEVMCAYLEPKDQLSPDLMRDLIRIYCIPQLQFTSALQWGQMHLHQIHDARVQWVLDQCFFTSDCVQQQIMQEPRLINHFRAFIEEGINASSSQLHELETTLFFLRIGLFFETHVKTVYGEKASSLQNKHLHKMLQSLYKLTQNESVASLLAFSILRQADPDLSHLSTYLSKLNKGGWLEGKIRQECMLRGIDFRPGAIQKEEFSTPLSLERISFDAERLAEMGLLFLQSDTMIYYASKDHSYIYAVDSKENIPLFRIDIESEQSIISLVDKTWKPLPIRLANLWNVKVSTQDPLYLFTLRLARQKDVLCWVNIENGEIEQVWFTKMRLRLKNIRGRLFCDHTAFSGYFLDQEQTLSALNHYLGSLVLANARGEKKVILPFVELAIDREEDFSKNVIPTSCFLSKTETICAYTLNEKMDMLEGNALANFYLIYLFALQQAHSRALSYLKKQKPSAGVDHIVDLFIYNKDRSPSTLALNLHLLSYLFDYKNLLTRERLSTQVAEGMTLKKWVHWGAKTYAEYLSVISSVPISLRIDLEQEKKLLRSFKRHNARYYPIIKMRQALILDGRGSVEAAIQPSTFSMNPQGLGEQKEIQTFSDLRLRSQDPFPYRANSENWTLYPTRVDLQYLESHFLTFYEIAKAAASSEVHPFDITLLTLMGGDLDLKGRKLVKILFLVRHFPQFFPVDLFDHESFNELLPICEHLSQKADVKNAYKALKNSVKLDYAKRTLLEVSEEIQTDAIAIFPYKKAVASRTKETLELLFERQTAFPNLPELPPFFDPKLMPQEGTIESLLFNNLLEGYEELGHEERVSYLSRSGDLKKAISILQNEMRAAQSKAQEVRKKINRLANHPRWNTETSSRKKEIFEEISLNCLRSSEQMIKLTFDNPLVEAVLQNDGALILQHEPNLTREDLARLMTYVIDYHMEIRNMQHLEEAIILLSKLKKDKQQDLEPLANLLNQDMHYDPYKLPELLIYEVVSGKRMRSYQVDVYIDALGDACKLRTYLFGLLTGGGKSSILAPLFIMRAIREGYLPIFFTNNAMYSVDKDNIINRLLPFGKAPGVFEVAISEQLDARALQLAYEELSGYYKQKRPIVMTPENYYALHLQYLYSGIILQDEERVKWLSLILFEVFEGKTFQVMDEAPTNLDPSLKAIFGISKASLPEEDRALIFEMFRPLLGIVKINIKNKELTSFVRLHENEQAIASNDPENLLLAKKGVCHHMALSKLLNIPKEERSAVIHYWLNDDAKKPGFLLKADRKTAHLIQLTRYFVQIILPEVMEARSRMDHAPSTFAGEEFDVPFIRTEASFAHYECPYRALAMSIQGTFHRGLTQKQVSKLIELLKLSHQEEASSLIFEEEMTAAQALFSKWLKKTELNNLKLQDVATQDLRMMRTLFHHMKKNKGALEWYLSQVIARQITYSPKQLTCTPSHLMRRCKKSLLCSATPGIPQGYPRLLEAFKEDLSFQAAIVTEFCAAHNQGKYFSKTKDPKQFLLELLDAQPRVFDRVRVLDDPGGYFCDSTNDEIAGACLEVIVEKKLSLDGVVYFQNASNRLLIRIKGRLEPIHVDGSDVKSALEREGLEWEHLELLILFDPSHTQSADIAQKKETDALLFVGPKLTRSVLVQAIGRLRGFLEDQHIIWVFHEGLAEHFPLGSTGEIDGASINAWTTANEAEDLKKRIVLLAFQEIDYFIQEPALNDVKKYLYNPKRQVEQLVKYSGGFLEEKNMQFELSLENRETADVFMAFVNERLNAFGYSEKWEEIKEPILYIIEEVEGLMTKIPANYKQAYPQAVKQYSHVRQQTKQTLLPSRSAYLEAVKDAGLSFSLLSDTFLQDIEKSSMPVSQLFDSPSFSPNFRLTYNQIETAKKGEKHLKIKYLKPIEYLLISYCKEEPTAYGVSNEEVKSIQSQLRIGCSFPVFLITADGMIVHAGSCQEQEVSSIMDSSWLKNVLVDVALLQGQIKYPDLLYDRLQEWTDFNNTWEKILKGLPHPETANRFAIQKLIDPEPLSKEKKKQNRSLIF